MTATAADLPEAVLAALGSPAAGERGSVDAAGIRWATVAWGDPAAPPLLLLHGVTSSSSVWWRTAPALAAGGYRVVAVDLPGHGATGQWNGHYRFRDMADDVASFIRAAAMDRGDLRVIGHSWGAMTSAALPLAGILPRVLVLLDPPALPVADMETMLHDPVDHAYDDVDDAVAALRVANPTWSDGDIRAKANGLAHFDVDAVRAVLLDNGDWDGGLSSLRASADRGVDTWIVRGEPATGGMIPDAAVPALAAVVGADHVVTIAGAPHSPQRTHPVPTLVALLGALASA
ncbi:MAG: alpha/beta fold hydrolase [Chloroflexota bacterium]